METFTCDCCSVKLNSEATMKAHLEGKKHLRQKAMLERRMEESERGIYVTNLPFKGNLEELLRDYFMNFGSVKNVAVDPKNRFFSIVEFTSKSSAAMALLHTNHWLEGKKLRVRKKRVNYPQRRNKNIYKQTEESDERMHECLMEKILRYKSIKDQMIVLKTELCLRESSLAIRQEIRKGLNTVLTHYIPNSELHLFGSSANGFGFEGCDMDLHLKLPANWSETEDSGLIENPPQIKDIESGNTKLELYSNSAKLKMIRKIIERHVSNAKGVIYIPSHRCPLLRFKYKHSEGELICDLSIGKGLSVRNTNLLWLYSTLDSRVLLLVATLRYWAKCQNLINSDCKLTSYAFTFLVIFFLQTLNLPMLPSVEELKQLAETKCLIDNWDCSFCKDINKIPKSNNKQPVEQLLRDFFHFYATFDYKAHIISPRFGNVISQSVFSSDPSYKEFKIGQICIQDPFILNRNIAGNFNIKYFPELIAKFTHCAKLCEADHIAQDGNHGLVALMKEIVVENDETESVSFVVTPKDDKYRMCNNSLNANLSDQQIMKVWFKKVCLLVKDVLERALCCECEIVDLCKNEKQQLTRKRSLSFDYDNEQKQKHFMRDDALVDREGTSIHNVPTTFIPNIADKSEQTGESHVKINSKNAESEISFSGNQFVHSSSTGIEFSLDEEMPYSDDSETQSAILFQKSDQCNNVLDSKHILFHMHCKVNDDIWQERKKESKKYKLEKCNILDIEHKISQTIIQKYGKNKLLFDCMIRKLQMEGITGIEVEMKPQSKNSYKKIKQYIVPFVSKLVCKCMSSLSL